MKTRGFEMRHKYRVWCEFEIDGKLHKEMAGPENWFLLTQTGKLMSHSPMGFNPNVEQQHTKLIPLFWTGLCDKKGKEIYEGDIVKQEFVVPADPAFDRDGFEGEDTGIATILPSRGACIAFNKQYKNIRTYRSEIIGNRFENPQLLEEKQ